ncbi:GrpB family protein [Peptostreptococcus porci]|uniref:GrpB family protein n=1 Tax=Peptostreptococcus porci TaxID=2652282 RepID=UPI002ED02DB1
MFLVEHNKEWIKWYEEEREMILSSVPSKSIKRISHIGSTAILGICAKNIVDILLEVKDKSKL